MSKIAIDTQLPNQSHTSPPSFKQPAVLYTIPQPVFRLISRLLNHYPVSRPIHRSLHQSPVLQPQDPAAGVRHPLIVAGHQHRLPASFKSFKRLIIPAPVAESRFPVGSSARINSGSSSSARAMATRCCSPPESSPGGASTPARPSRRSSSRRAPASAARFPGRPAQARSAARSGRDQAVGLKIKPAFSLR